MGAAHPVDGALLSAPLLGQLMPMFVLLGADARIRALGPTLEKLVGAGARGQPLDRVFHLRRPATMRTLRDLLVEPRLSLTLQGDRRTRFKGIAVALDADAGAVLNLSFGYALGEVVRDFGLSEQDFAPTDLAIEMLYLVEAKSLVSQEIEQMARRLGEARRSAEARAQTDALTGLGNRRALDEALNHLVAQEREFCLVNVDLDFFKAVNDTLGHAAGDHVLTRVAEILRHAVRGGDTVARVGGDEFVMILAGVNEAELLSRIGDRLLRKVAAPIPFQGQPCRIALSMGAAFFRPGRDESVADLIRRADEALYASKRAGRRRLSLTRHDGTIRELVVGEEHPPARRQNEDLPEMRLA